MIDYSAILIRHYQGSEWVLEGEEYEGLTWLSDTLKPTKEDLDALWDETFQMIESEKQIKINVRESAKAKLAALGLTEAEINAIIGGA